MRKPPLEPATLAIDAASAGLSLRVRGGVEEAIDSAGARRGLPRMLICGSLYLAGEVLASQETVPN